ncbi:hypothetical protein [Tepidanaerobacter acetatoxydans]|nr:hypothetical protein [Tepidanaerobacter acetatoxydans]AEE90972.1 hypothetical protein TepRe1_0789 [Tepidanaerobacter acetatoxydans Re1]
MFTHVAKCTNNFIRVPPRPVGPIEVRLPVVVAKKNISFLIPIRNSLPDIPEKIKKVDFLVEKVSFHIVKGLVMFDIEFLEDIYYVYNGIVKNAAFYELFSDSVSIPEAKSHMEVIYNIDTHLTYKTFEKDILKQIVVNMYIELIEYRNIFI